MKSKEVKEKITELIDFLLWITWTLRVKLQDGSSRQVWLWLVLYLRKWSLSSTVSRKAAVQCLTDSKAEHSRRTGAQG